MYLKVKNFVEDLTGFSIYRTNTPWGHNIYNDLKRLKPDWSPQIIFDVGANVGQTAIAFHKAWPNAKIFSFEPVKDTFAILKTATQNLPNIEAVPMALGSSSGESSIKIFSDSRLASLDCNLSIRPSTNYETIKILTSDEFCTLHSIDSVSLLKIDTEGYDLEVLKGSINLLKNEKIDFVIAEIAANSCPGKISLAEMDNFLNDYEMICIGIYEQDFWQQVGLYYGNSLFVRKTLIS